MVDVSKRRFGRLCAEWPAAMRGHGNACWLCLCDCGRLRVVALSSLLNGSSKSCGCLQKELLSRRRFKHGHSIKPGVRNASREYETWLSMKARCYDRKTKSYKNYGGRGIRVCGRWLSSFENFLADMGTKPNGLTLERIDNDGNYEPSNCKWATRLEQNRNKRNSRRNRQ